MRRTNLALVASPGRGSVVLEFSPVASTEAEERYPGGELTFEGPKQPLVQRAVEVALGVIDLAAIEDPLAYPPISPSSARAWPPRRSSSPACSCRPVRRGHDLGRTRAHAPA